MKNKPDPALSGGSFLFNEIKKEHQNLFSPLMLLYKASRNLKKSLGHKISKQQLLALLSYFYK
jgi:hypothetical protein